MWQKQQQPERPASPATSDGLGEGVSSRTHVCMLVLSVFCNQHAIKRKSSHQFIHYHMFDNIFEIIIFLSFIDIVIFVVFQIFIYIRPFFSGMYPCLFSLFSVISMRLKEKVHINLFIIIF